MFLRYGEVLAKERELQGERASIEGGKHDHPRVCAEVCVCARVRVYAAMSILLYIEHEYL